MVKKSDLFRDEKGVVLVYVTIVLVMTMLIIPPLLGFIGGAGRSAQIREDRMLQVYAADAGVEDGYYRLIEGNFSEPWEIEDLNGYGISVEVVPETDALYKIVSTATSEIGGNITIEAYAATVTFGSLMDNALSSRGDMKIGHDVIIDGNITYALDLQEHKTANVTGEKINDDMLWPTCEDGDPNNIKDFYLEKTNGDCSGNLSDMGGCIWPGDLSVGNGETIIFTGISPYDAVYVQGDFLMSPGSTMYMYGNALFIEGSADLQPGSYLYGPGVIVACGSVHFKPHMANEDFIFVMSINGELKVQPHGTFVGSMAGNIEVEYLSGSSIRWESPPSGMPFPSGDYMIPGIRSYFIRD